MKQGIDVDVKLSITKGALVFDFDCDADDGVYNDKIKMNRNSFFVKLQKGTKIEDIHPDHLGLAIILAVIFAVGIVFASPYGGQHEPMTWLIWVYQNMSL